MKASKADLVNGLVNGDKLHYTKFGLISLHSYDSLTWSKLINNYVLSLTFVSFVYKFINKVCRRD